MSRFVFALALAACASAELPSTEGNAPDGGTGGSAMADATLAPDACGDSDGDSVCNAVDACPGHNDALDMDGDTVANGCDVCPSADDRPDINTNSVADCSELQARTIDVKVVGSNVWRGWYTSTGSHTSSNDNTLTGISSGETYNSYHVFAITGFTPGLITKATLQLQLEVYNSTKATETVSVWNVTATGSSVETTTSSTTIFADLQSGNQYATATVNNAQVNQIVSIPLSVQAVTDIAAKLGNDFVVGVHLDTAAGTSNYIRFGHTPASTNPTIIRLALEYLP